MENKKHILRVMSIGLMLSILAPVHASEPKLTKMRLYRKCIAKKCNAAEEAQVRADAKKAGKWAGAALLAAAVAVGLKKASDAGLLTRPEASAKRATKNNLNAAARKVLGRELDQEEIDLNMLNLITLYKQHHGDQEPSFVDLKYFYNGRTADAPFKMQYTTIYGLGAEKAVYPGLPWPN